MLSVATLPMVVAGPITRVPNPITTITTHTLTGEGTRLVISLPGHCVGQAGGCQEVAAEDSVRCSTITGEKKTGETILTPLGELV